MINVKIIKNVLLVMMLLIAVMLWTKWQVKYHPQTPVPQKSQTKSVKTSESEAPNLSIGKTTSSTATESSAANIPLSPQSSLSTNTISVKTDLLDVSIDLNGGNIIGADLLKYPKVLHSSAPLPLLYQNEQGRNIAQSGLIGQGMPSTMKFSAQQTHYQLGHDQKVKVNLTWHDNNGISVIKTYTFTQGKYLIKVGMHVLNKGKTTWHGRFYQQLSRTKPVSAHGFLQSYTAYTGAAYSTPEHHFEKLKLNSIAENNLSAMSQGGWISMLQSYFVSAWVPNQSQSNQFYSRFYHQNIYSVGSAGQTFSVAPGQNKLQSANLYVGPAIASRLDKVGAPHLDLAINYGWLFFISKPLFTIMSFIHRYVGNWGLAIMIMTFLIKLLFFPLSAKSYRSMAKMRHLQPKMKQLKERFGDDKQAFTKAMMALYKKEKANPLGGCLPMIIQIPVFISFYYMLMASVELRHAPFIFWIHDLSVKDPYYILPVIMMGSMFLQQKLSPPPPDPTQAKMMLFMPLVFGLMFLNFASGLVLYWIVNNCLGILQQWFTIHHYEQSLKKRKAKTGTVIKRK